MDIRYIESERRTVQGKKSEIIKKYGKEWHISERGGGNGNWLLTKNSDILVDGKSRRSFVLEYYGRARLTPGLVEKFKADIARGKIAL